VQKRRHEEAKQERKNTGPKHTARRKLIKDSKLNAFQCAISATEAANMAISCVVMTVKLFIMNYG
jgi:hypothetical protein